MCECSWLKLGWGVACGVLVPTGVVPRRATVPVKAFLPNELGWSNLAVSSFWRGGVGFRAAAEFRVLVG